MTRSSFPKGESNDVIETDSVSQTDTGITMSYRPFDYFTMEWGQDLLISQDAFPSKYTEQTSCF